MCKIGASPPFSKAYQLEDSAFKLKSACSDCEASRQTLFVHRACMRVPLSRLSRFLTLLRATFVETRESGSDVDAAALEVCRPSDHQNGFVLSSSCVGSFFFPGPLFNERCLCVCGFLVRKREDDSLRCFSAFSSLAGAQEQDPWRRGARVRGREGGRRHARGVFSPPGEFIRQSSYMPLFFFGALVCWFNPA